MNDELEKAEDLGLIAVLGVPAKMPPRNTAWVLPAAYAFAEKLQGRSMSIFVFGSNEAGRHGAGAAKAARKHGAIYGQGRGRQGDSYAIPTKDKRLKTRALDDIELDVINFIEYARAHPELTFEVTRIGCGLAGYTDDQIAPMFSTAPSNCNLPEGWRFPHNHTTKQEER